eukprot:TRINITY_DN936_c3_g4_i1.p1 TRINITY_DN936_c3_g4~~TRINITY_DN936_c3_g4_i1.p1  ORF type:complete len:127 (+),score=29.64 TRINITY_DN936_c3_g4_i1:281-661(+)
MRALMLTLNTGRLKQRCSVVDAAAPHVLCKLLLLLLLLPAAAAATTVAGGAGSRPLSQVVHKLRSALLFRGLLVSARAASAEHTESPPRRVDGQLISAKTGSVACALSSGCFGTPAVTVRLGLAAN